MPRHTQGMPRVRIFRIAMEEPNRRLSLFVAVDALLLRREPLRDLPDFSVLLVVAIDEETKKGRAELQRANAYVRVCQRREARKRVAMHEQRMFAGVCRRHQ